MPAQGTDSVAACPTDHHGPQAHAQATGLHRYLCHWFRSPTSRDSTLTKVGTPDLPSPTPSVSIASRVSSHLVLQEGPTSSTGQPSQCSQGQLQIALCHHRLFVIPGTESRLLLVAHSVSVRKQFPTSAWQNSSSSCPAISACHALAASAVPQRDAC